jgi:SAM-dependent methyltransferase
MKVLVVIPNHGTKNDGYLARALAEFRSMPYQTDFVLLSNLQKSQGKDVEVLTGTPTKNPHSLPFGHRKVFSERRDAYDLFIYTEDDILITQRNIEAHLRAVSVLPADRLAGFFRYETYPGGKLFYPDAHEFFRWVPGSLQQHGDQTFARYTNEHSGCYALTRAQLGRAIASGGFLVPPHEGLYGMLETAATDIFTQCGFQKVLSVSNFEDFLVPHLPNKYLGKLGVDAVEFDRQVDALRGRRPLEAPSASLLEPRSRAFHALGSKDLYEPAREDLLAQFPAGTRSVLSIGCGWGAMEAALMRRGIEVKAIPVDSIIGVRAESRGVQLVHGMFEQALRQLRGERFDGILMSNMLQLIDDPASAIQNTAALLNKGGRFVATMPAFHTLPMVVKRLRNPEQYRGWDDFAHSGLHVFGRRAMRRLFRNAGLLMEKTIRKVPPHREKQVAASGGLLRPLFASEHIYVARQEGLSLLRT